MDFSDLPAIAEYSSAIAMAHPSRRVTLDEKQAEICGSTRTVELARVTAGYVPAGSAMRLQCREAFSVRWHDGRAYHGQQHTTEEAARAHFATF